ncbi:Rnf-Nqr domain containing protein [Pseudomonas asiatica]|uniref:Rnf-Nqr domain containing protein n=1 Tax=Pseudomonas asiatica TaxID=2219225 RepID=A0ABU5L483_9PSED|nr:Rnf-Nqr domain containing protein [Pseudomonas asiatica]MDZ5740875.1 Rnf-Nqr domain containing protein [Pseudomonas asiatica]MDZ5745896.1 Rnf-Nqr domain containing protein [Pseudomonas asiatica]MDZ5751110.1 Rnf-Nqr domain containing protein [Pseudomonas asiatica]MDZ5756168.1 Rnf-Nqr domain containing protein [Pseudomonas asiatica]
MSDYILVLISAALVNHLCLQQQPFPRLHLHVHALACALCIALGVIGAQLLVRGVLAPLQAQDLALFLLLPWLAVLAWGVPWLLTRWRPSWPVTQLPALLLSNAVVLGLTLQQASDESTWLATLLQGLLAGGGFWLALVLFADLRQRSAHADVPGAMRGLPIELLGAGVMAMAFSGFNGLFAQ